MNNKNKVGLVFGLFMSFLHFIWALLVISGVGQILLDFIYKIHSLNNPFIVQPFNLGRTIILLIVTFCVGYVFGFILSAIWRKFQK